MVGCGGAEYAREEGIPVLLFPKTSTLNEGLSAVDLVSSLRWGLLIEFHLSFFQMLPFFLLYIFYLCWKERLPYVFPHLKTILSSFQLFILFWISYLNREFEIDFVLLAGFLKLIPVELVRAYPKSILNIHPSLLPSFGGKGYYGLKVHKAVIASGARWGRLHEFCVLDVCLCFGMFSSQELYFKAIWNLNGLY